MLKAVLFDLDHTLIDWAAAEPWEDYQTQRLTKVFDFVNDHLHPMTHTDADSFFVTYFTTVQAAWARGSETLIAPTVRAMLTDTLTACGVPEHKIDPDALGRVYDWGLIPGERAFEDVPEVLPQLRAYGLELGIVTNASAPMTYRDRELRALDLLDYFPTCRVSAADVGYIKPHRSIFDRALDILGIRASEAVFVGDSLEADIKGAQGIGMLAVWRPQSDGSGSPANNIAPDGSITTLHDLLPLLDGWFPGWREEASEDLR
ncbi:MAG: HAD family hydrolase [Anaerolineae bacterium]|nr:HAD family hydrolase [Anaerolineae bacterium]